MRAVMLSILNSISEFAFFLLFMASIAYVFAVAGTELFGHTLVQTGHHNTQPHGLFRAI